MNHDWLFVKYVGCGNDFILFDNRLGKFPKDPSILSQLCHRQKGVGADGVILLEDTTSADFRMRIFNADGTEAEMCGNGIRCLMRFLAYLGYLAPKYTIEVAHRVLTVELDEEQVKVAMSDPVNDQWNISLPVENEILPVHFLDTGVPHTILFVKNLTEIDIKKLGRIIRSHPRFQPKGTNVNFAQLIDEHTLQIRTYERGVEDETLSCGTGATAAALAAAYEFRLTSPIHVITQSSDLLKVTFDRINDSFSNITLTGPAHSTFQGIVRV